MKSQLIIIFAASVVLSQGVFGFRLNGLSDPEGQELSPREKAAVTKAVRNMKRDEKRKQRKEEVQHRADVKACYDSNRLAFEKDREAFATLFKELKEKFAGSKELKAFKKSVSLLNLPFGSLSEEEKQALAADYQKRRNDAYTLLSSINVKLEHAEIAKMRFENRIVFLDDDNLVQLSLGFTSPERGIYARSDITLNTKTGEISAAPAEFYYSLRYFGGIKGYCEEKLAPLLFQAPAEQVEAAAADLPAADVPGAN